MRRGDPAERLDAVPGPAGRAAAVSKMIGDPKV
jgi:hypothetical protein